MASPDASENALSIQESNIYITYSSLYASYAIMTLVIYDSSWVNPYHALTRFLLTTWVDSFDGRWWGETTRFSGYNEANLMIRWNSSGLVREKLIYRRVCWYPQNNWNAKTSWIYVVVRVQFKQLSQRKIPYMLLRTESLELLVQLYVLYVLIDNSILNLRSSTSLS